MNKFELMEQYDMLVVGSGPAGRRAAIQSAKLGKSVLVVDKGSSLGGVSVHTGTIPSKTWRETALNLSGWRERAFYGLGYRVKQNISMSDLRKRLERTLDYEVEDLQSQFMRNGVRWQQAAVQFTGPHSAQLTLESGEKQNVQFDKGLIAVGTRPHRPDGIDFSHPRISDSDAILNIAKLPRSTIVLGAGVIGVEYATILSAMDTRITLIDGKPDILDFVDQQIVADFRHDLRDRGIDMRLGTEVHSITAHEDDVEVTLGDGRVVRAEMLLCCAGRSGNVESLGLDALGLVPDKRGRIPVNTFTCQTKIPHIYAAGDVIGFPSLASTAMEQGRVAACHAFGAPIPAPQTFPVGIYAVPEISTVGHSEEQVRASGVAYECGVARFREISRGHIMGVQSGTLKLIFARDTRKLLGAHIVGEGATELIHIGQAVINLGGTVDFFVDNTFNYPTLAEAYKVAGLDAWNRMSQVTASSLHG